MAGAKIKQYDVLGRAIINTDLFDTSADLGGGASDSRSITGQDILDYTAATPLTIMKTDDIADANHTQDLNDFDIFFEDKSNNLVFGLLGLGNPDDATIGSAVYKDLQYAAIDATAILTANDSPQARFRSTFWDGANNIKELKIGATNFGGFGERQLNFFNDADAVVMTVTDASKSVLIGTQTNDLSSIFTLESTDKGMLCPRMDTIDRDAISFPADGLLIYNTDTDTFNYFDSTAWVTLGANLFNTDALDLAGDFTHFLDGNDFVIEGASSAKALVLFANGGFAAGGATTIPGGSIRHITIGSGAKTNALAAGENGTAIGQGTEVDDNHGFSFGDEGTKATTEAIAGGRNTFGGPQTTAIGLTAGNINSVGSAFYGMFAGRFSRSFQPVLNNAIMINAGPREGANVFVDTKGNRGHGWHTLWIDTVNYLKAGSNTTFWKIALPPSANIQGIQQFPDHDTKTVASSTASAVFTFGGGAAYTLNTGANDTSGIVKGTVLRIEYGDSDRVQFSNVVSNVGSVITMDSQLEGIADLDADTTTPGTETVMIVSDFSMKFRNDNDEIIKLFPQDNTVTPATFVANSSGISNDTATWGGFTLGEAMQVLFNVGLLK